MNKRQRKKQERKKFDELFKTTKITAYEDLLLTTKEVTKTVPPYAFLEFAYATTTSEEERRKLLYHMIKLGGDMDAIYVRVTSQNHGGVPVGEICLVDTARHGTNEFASTFYAHNVWLLREDKADRYKDGWNGERGYYAGELVEGDKFEVVYDGGFRRTKGNIKKNVRTGNVYE